MSAERSFRRDGLGRVKKQLFEGTGTSGKAALTL